MDLALNNLQRLICHKTQTIITIQNVRTGASPSDSLMSYAGHLLGSSSQMGLQNTLTASLQRGKTCPPISVLDMTLNNLMVRFQ